MNTISHKATVVFFSLISLLICAGFCSCGSTKTDNENSEIIIDTRDVCINKDNNIPIINHRKLL